MSSKDLFDKITCALTHNISVCSNCKKCGSNGADIRMSLIKELADEMGFSYPWENNNETSRENRENTRTNY